jgi:hypothetical protein
VERLRLDLGDERRLARLAADGVERAVPHLERHDLAADEADLVDPVDGGIGPEPHVDGVHAPAVSRRGRAHRLPAPLRERAEHVVEGAPLRRQLVDRHRRRRRQLRPPHDTGALQVAEPSREDVRADAGERVREIGVAPLAEHQLAHDEQRPAIPDQVEGMGNGAVLVIALHGHDR